MAQHHIQHGVSQRQDLSPYLLQREIRPFSERFRDSAREFGAMAAGALALFTIWFGGVVADLGLILGLPAILIMIQLTRRWDAYPFRRPAADGGKGIFYLGNDRENNAGAWFTDSDLRTHMLVFGSTGSGKTRFLLGLMYQAMLNGSGVMYVDGKGDNTVWWLVYSLCRRLGREDDLLLVNYMTGAENIDPDIRGQRGRLANTSNPFAYGTADQLRSMVVGLMREAGGDGSMWKGRTSALLSGVLRCLVWMRDQGEIQLSVGLIRQYLVLDRVMDLVRRDDIPEQNMRPLRAYLHELPGYTEADAEAGDLNPKCYEQHGYLTMQLTEAMGDLSETYGHIFNTALGEVDFKDVVFNRRILFVMLPALEKDPDALGNLGKLVVAGVRSALAPALGNKVEGEKREVLDVKPTNAKVPFTMILDEYGYYAVKGFAVVAAQARSLGVSVVFAGQDYQAFKGGSPEEAASTVANTNIKICMKLEDPTETFEIFEKRAGRSKVAQTTGQEYNTSSLIGGYRDQNTVRSEDQARINIRDLVAQNPGEGHVLFGDTLIRARLFAVLTEQEDPAGGVFEVPLVKVNQFLPVRTPSKSQIEQMNGTRRKIESLFAPGHGVESEQSDLDPALEQVFEDYRTGQSRGLSCVDASITALGRLELSTRKDDRELKQRTAEPEPEPEAERPEPIGTGANRAPASESVEQEVAQPQAPTQTELQAQASEYANLFEGVLNQVIEANVFPEGSPISPAERAAAAPRAQLAETERRYGRSEEEADREAARAIGSLQEGIDYPKPPVPGRADQETILEALQRLRQNAAKGALK